MSALSLTTRIAGGFVLVATLTLSVTGTGLWGLSSIQTSLTAVTDKSQPMMDAIGGLQGGLLEAQLRLSHLLKQSESSKLDEIEERFRTAEAETTEHFSKLGSLAEGDEGLKESLKNLNGPLATIGTNSQQAIDDYRQALLKTEDLKRQQRILGDTGDQLIAMSSALRSSRQDLASGIDEFLTGIETTNEFALRTLRETLPAAVRGAEKRLTKMLTRLDTMFAAFSGATDPAFKTEFAKYLVLLSGEQGLLAQHATTLELRRKASAEEEGVNAQQQGLFDQTHALESAVLALANKNSESANAAVSSARTAMLTLSGLAIAASILISLAIISNLRRRLSELVGYVGVVATGDLRQNLIHTSDDELGTLAKGTNTLAVKLRQVIAEIGQGAEQLAAAAEQMSQISGQSLHSIELQKQQTEQISASSCEMAATVHEVARNVTETLHRVESADRDIADSQAEVDQNIGLINQLAANIEKSASVIQNVSEQSQTIGSVLDVIRGIAEQTNLLALNAAIEAARAGEHGRGFAVVADEVRTLASRTQSSTTEIHETIKRLQSGVEEAVSVMAASQSNADASVSHITKVGERLRQISAGIATIKDMSAQIASATEEQSAATVEQDKNVSAIADAAEQNANAARDGNAASQELARMAETLRELVTQFQT